MWYNLLIDGVITCMINNGGDILMNTILSIANAALQYNRGRQTGLAGLTGIAIALLAAYNWDHLVPVFEALGIVGFLNKHGLIFEGEGGLTGFVIFMMLFRATILFCVMGFAVIVIGIIIGMIFSSNIGIAIMSPFILIMALPYYLVTGIYNHFFIPEHVKEERMVLEKKRFKERNETVIDIINESSEQISQETAEVRLNRLPTKGDDLFIVGITSKNQMVLLLPKPQVVYLEDISSDDWAGINCKVEKYKKIGSHNYMMEPEKLKIEIEYPNYPVHGVPKDKIETYFLTSQKDIKRICQHITLQTYFYKYVKNVQNNYFNRKEKVLKNISNALEKETFDRLVERAKSYNASNEAIVRMILDNETNVEVKEQF